MDVTMATTNDNGLKVGQSFPQDFIDVLQKIDQKILKIEALDLNSLDVASRYKNYHNSGTFLTGEENANIGTKMHPSHRRGKVYEPWEKLVSYWSLYESLKSEFGQEKAQNDLYSMLAGNIAGNDSTDFDMIYCIAISTSHLMREGRNYVKDVPNVPPTSSRSYMNMCTETLYDLSAECKGATVEFDLLIGLAYYTKREREARRESYKFLSPSQAELIAASETSSSSRSTEEAMEKLKKFLKENNSYDNNAAADYVTDFHITNILQGWVHLMGNKFRHAFQSLFTNLNLFSPRILKDSFDYYRYPNGDTIDGYIDEIINIQKLFAKFFSKGIKGLNGESRVVAMPVVTLLVPNDDAGAEDLQKQDDEFVDFILKEFSLYNNINVYRGLKLAMCCRLIIDHKSHAVSVNSFGVKTNTDSGNDAQGSFRVVVADLAAIALDVASCLPDIDNDNFFIKYKEKLNEELDRIEEILVAQRKLVMRRDEEGLFRFTKNGWINPDKLASTYGALGIYEAVKIINNSNWETGYNEKELEIANEILKIIDQKCQSSTEKYGYTFNMEAMIPGESMCHRLQQRSLERFGYTPYSELSNQFVPLTLECDLKDSMEWENKLGSVIESTGIKHININGDLNPEQSLRIHKNIWKNYPYVSHYALNGTIYTCENNHNFMKKTEKCPICGGKIVEAVSRSIGYFKSVPHDFGNFRREEHSRRKWLSPEVLINEE
jgi:anaerobic ribonucleoside-triphosphate reductase